MALTNDEIDELKQAVINEIKSESNDVTELETATTLDGATGLPTMQGTKMVLMPIDLLAKPANDAAAKANTATAEANDAAAKANEATDTALTAALLVEVSTDGATARFDAFETILGSISEMSTTTAGGTIVYVKNHKKFAYKLGTTYYNNWSVEGLPTATMFMSDNLQEVRKNKVFLCGNRAYAWGTLINDIVDIDGMAVITIAEMDLTHVQVLETLKSNLPMRYVIRRGDSKNYVCGYLDVFTSPDGRILTEIYTGSCNLASDPTGAVYDDKGSFQAIRHYRICGSGTPTAMSWSDWQSWGASDVATDEEIDDALGITAASEANAASEAANEVSE